MWWEFTTNDNGLEPLERMKGATGSTKHAPTDRQLKKGREVGTTLNSNYFVCRKIRKKMMILITCKPA